MQTIIINKKQMNVLNRRYFDILRCNKMSLYSREVMSIFENQFPNYLDDILEYGFLHPQLVSYINEDPMLICSLMDLGKRRWLTPKESGAYIEDRSIYLTGDMYIKTVFKWTGYLGTYKSPLYGPSGSSNSDSYCRYILLSSGGSGKMRYMYNGAAGLINDSVSAPAANYVHTLVDYQGSLTCDNMRLINVGAKSFTCSRPFRLFSVWGGSDMGTYISSLEIYSTQGGTLLKSYVPFVSETRQGVLEISNLNNPIFYGRATTATFDAEVTNI